MLPGAEEENNDVGVLDRWLSSDDLGREAVDVESVQVIFGRRTELTSVEIVTVCSSSSGLVTTTDSRIVVTEVLCL